MLTFVGLGLWDEKDISLKGLEAIRAADFVYAEFYTSQLSGTAQEKMEALYGKKVRILRREDIENNPREILENAKKGNVVLLSGGDPMIATTHVDLRLRAKDAGIETKIIHGASISSAVIGLTGLQNYKFGKSASIAFPYKEEISEVPYETVRMNKKNGLHTLLYLDLPMTIPQAIELLSEFEKRKKDKIISGLIVGIARAGSDSPLVRAGSAEELKKFDFGEPLHTLVFPGELHFMEKEALEKLCGTVF